MEKLFVSYTIAFKLKKLGFNELSIAFWNDYRELHYNHTYNLYDMHMKAPMYQQVVDWFREKHNLLIVINRNRQDDSWYCHVIRDDKCIFSLHDIESYYEVLNKAIEELVEKVIKNIQK